MSPNQPDAWSSFFAQLKNWTFKGFRKYITIPLLLFVVGYPTARAALGYLKTDVQSGLELMNQTTIITEDEDDVMDEWVASIWDYQTKEEAHEALAEFRLEYEKLGHKIHAPDIYLVRSVTFEGAYAIVIDMGRGVSSEAEVQGGIDAHKLYAYENGRKMGSSLSQLIDQSKPVLYTKGDFENFYGKIQNDR